MIGPLVFSVLPSCTFFRQISAHVDWKRCTKEGNPAVSLWKAGVFTHCPEQNYNSHIRIQSLFLVSHTHIDKNTNHSNSVLFLTWFLLINVACPTIYPLEEPKLKDKICYISTFANFILWVSVSGAYVYVCVSVIIVECACSCFIHALVMLTYLVACFVGFLHHHSPLVVQLHGHAAATIGMFPHPAEKLLQLPAQGGVGVPTGFGVTGAWHQPLWIERRQGGRENELRAAPNWNISIESKKDKRNTDRSIRRGKKAAKEKWETTQIYLVYCGNAAV